MKFLKIFCKIAAVVAILLIALRVVDAFYPLWTPVAIRSWLVLAPSYMLSIVRYTLLAIFMLALFFAAPKSAKLRIPALLGLVAAVYSIAINLNLVYAFGDHRLGYLLSYYTIVRTTLIQAMIFASFIWIATKLSSKTAKFFTGLMAIVAPFINLMWGMFYSKADAWLPTPDGMQISLFSLIIIVVILLVDMAFYFAFASSKNKIK